MNRLPVVTKYILMINVLLFLATLAAGRWGIDLDRYLALHFFFAEDFNVAQFFTYMFMHANFAHIFFNMFAVWMFGSVLERYLGSSKFLLFYVVCGLGGGLLHETISGIQFMQLSSSLPPNAVDEVINNGAAALQQGMNFVDPRMAELNISLNSTLVGASGAVFGILLGFGMRFPEERIFVFPIPVPIKAKWFVIGYAALELMLGINPAIRGNVAHFAHIGGMLFGLLLIMYWKYKREW